MVINARAGFGGFSLFQDPTIGQDNLHPYGSDICMSDGFDFHPYRALNRSVEPDIRDGRGMHEIPDGHLVNADIPALFLFPLFQA